MTEYDNKATDFLASARIRIVKTFTGNKKHFPEDEDLEEQDDGGGLCTISKSEWQKLKNGTPEKILKLVEEKTLFIWELMGYGGNDFSGLKE